MQQSGFTHGGFYNHFHSKEERAAEAVACAFEKSARGLSEKFASARSPEKAFERVITEYLSPAYRDSIRSFLTNCSALRGSTFVKGRQVSATRGELT
jgi:AcrR family transcriptional regulator